MKKIKFDLILPLLVVLVLVGNIYLAYRTGTADSQSGFADVTVTFIDKADCEECVSLLPFETYFRENGLSDDQMKLVEADSLHGRWLRHKYELTKVPTLLISGPVNDFEFMRGIIDSLGEFRKDAFVVTRVQPPYFDLAKKEIRGKFEVIYLDDESCSECYDVFLHEQVFERLGMKTDQVRKVDISEAEGQELIEKYFITEVPTILLRGEVNLYDGFVQTWRDAGSEEADGTYVLRAGVASMGTYKTLPDGEIIQPQAN